MNPRPTAESMGDCYPAHYGPHQEPPTISLSAAVTPKDAGDKTVATDAAVPQRPLYLRILPLRFVPGLRPFYRWLMDDCSQPAPAPREIVTRFGETTHAAPRAFELGCATGRYLQRLQRIGWKVTGVEPGIVPAATARDAGLDVHCGTLDSCAMPAAEFDLATAWLVLEHVPDCRHTLMQLFAILKPGGQLLISIPNAGCWEPRVFGRHWYVWELPRHLHYFTPDSIRRLLTECGYTSIRITHQRTMLNVVGSLGMSILSRFPRCRAGQWLKSYPGRPTLAGQLLLAPLSHMLAFIRQGGRLTISAQRPSGPLPS